MKIDYLSCTKMLYFAEKLLRDHTFEFPEKVDDDFAKRFDMTADELQEMIKQFRHDKLLVWTDMPTEIEDDYGKVKSEMTYDALTVNKKKVEKLIKYLKERYSIRQNPFIPREAVVSIAKQIESTFNQDELVRVLEALPSNTVIWQISSGKYTLVDLLFRYAYTETSEKPIKKRSLSFVLAEFLNPIYYNIKNKKVSYQLFEYINGIVSAYASKEDYMEWQKETKKYIKTKKINANQKKINIFELPSIENRNDDYLEKMQARSEVYMRTRREPSSDTFKQTKIIPGENSTVLIYSKETGDGKLRGIVMKRLKDGTQEKKIFDEAFKNRGHKINREIVIQLLSLENKIKDNAINPKELLSAAGDKPKYRKDNSQVQITNKINEVVKGIRKKTGLNTSELVNNNGNITLAI